METLHVLGIDHTVASISVRETIAFSKPEIVCALPTLLAGPSAVAEAMLLCTCNRTEVYLVNQGPLSAYPLEPFRRLRPSAPILDHSLNRYTYSGFQAIEHLFAVASSLRSQMLGDTQISRQLAAAVQLARSAGASGPYLNRAVDSALHCAKLVRTSTGLSAGGDSLGAEVLRILKNRFPQPVSIVVSGTGTLANEILGVLSRSSSAASAKPRVQLRGVWSSNAERGRSCAAAFGLYSLSSREFLDSLSNVDALVLAGAGPHPLLAPNVIAGRRAPLYILDLGIPRNLDASAFSTTNVLIRDIDSIQRSAAENRARRHQAVEKAHAVIQRQARRFAVRIESRSRTPFRAATYSTIEQLVQQLRPAAPTETANLRAGMHRLLGGFFTAIDLRNIA